MTKTNLLDLVHHLRQTNESVLQIEHQGTMCEAKIRHVSESTSTFMAELDVPNQTEKALKIVTFQELETLFVG